jgi:hypothetical protein
MQNYEEKLRIMGEAKRKMKKTNWLSENSACLVDRLNVACWPTRRGLLTDLTWLVDQLNVPCFSALQPSYYKKKCFFFCCSQ